LALFFLEASVIEESRSQSAIVMVSRNGESGPAGEPDCMHDNRVCLSSQETANRLRDGSIEGVGIDSGSSAHDILSNIALEACSVRRFKRRKSEPRQVGCRRTSETSSTGFCAMRGEST